MRVGGAGACLDLAEDPLCPPHVRRTAAAALAEILPQSEDEDLSVRLRGVYVDFVQSNDWELQVRPHLRSHSGNSLSFPLSSLLRYPYSPI